MRNRVFIIAEAGVNHNGDIRLAEKLIDTAKESGADAVKFQTFKAEKISVRNSQKADYQKKATSQAESQFEMLKRLELSDNNFKNLFKYSNEKNIMFLSSPFDTESVDFLNDLGMDIFKIPSGEITNYPLLKKIGGLKKNVILSTGMSDIDEIKSALDVLISEGTKKENITVLHCNTEYPTPLKDVNLNTMLTIRDELSIKTGYSDHTPGIEIPIAAAALGATVIEKHFTLDKNMEGPDHEASLEPDELKKMVQAVRNIEIAMGDGIKQPSSSELKNISVARKSIVASKNITGGEYFTEQNITAKRPGTGISPMEWNKVLGKQAKHDFKEDDLIEL